ncbi:MAG: glycosyltransferase [Phycisphaerae bacterium]|nr:glycosyltransferase [Phycisphaerae bacterium]
MRVVHFLTRVRTEDGGVARATLDLCAGLAQRGHDVTLVTFEARDVPESWKAGEPGHPKVLEIPPLGGPIKLLTRWSRRTLEILFSKTDLVHIQEIWLPASAHVAQIARRVGTPYVLSAHGMLDDWSMAQKGLKKRAYLRLVGNRMIRGAGAVHCTAEGEAMQARRWLPENRAGVAPLLLDIEPYRVLPAKAACREALPGDTSLPTIVFMGRLHPKKGLERLIEAAGMLSRSGREAEVLVAGTGPAEYQRTLESLAASEGVAERIHFLGHVVGADKTRVLRAGDMLVLPSYQENFGLVLVEALACGTPVVTTKAVDIWPELESSGSSLVIGSPEAGAVAGAVGRLIDDGAERRAMGDRGRRWVMEHLNRDRVLDQFDGLYGRAVSGA